MSLLHIHASASEGKRPSVVGGDDEAAFLDAVGNALGRALDGGGGPLAGRARALATAPSAKRVRPRLCFQLARALGLDALGLDARGDGGRIVDTCVGIELIHLASLVHDDVVDASAERRGLPSVNAIEGNATAVLVGDEILCRALALFDDRALLTRAIAAVQSMAAGALFELEARGDVALSVDRWRAIAEGKTGALFSLCGASAAILAGAAHREDSFALACRELGVAFQAADDIIDLASGQDLDERTPSLPFAVASARAPLLAGDIARYWARAHPDPRERARLIDALVAAMADLAGDPSAPIAVARDAVGRARRAFGEDAPRVERVLADAERRIDELEARLDAHQAPAPLGRVKATIDGGTR